MLFKNRAAGSTRVSVCLSVPLVTSVSASLADPRCNNSHRRLGCDVCWSVVLRTSQWGRGCAYRWKRFGSEAGSVVLVKYFIKKSFDWLRGGALLSRVTDLTVGDTLLALDSLNSRPASLPCSTRRLISKNTQKKDSWKWEDNKKVQLVNFYVVITASICRRKSWLSTETVSYFVSDVEQQGVCLSAVGLKPQQFPHFFVRPLHQCHAVACSLVICRTLGPGNPKQSI